MDILVERKPLEKSLYLIQGIVEKKGAYAVVSNVLLKAEGKVLTLSATNLEMGFRQEIPVMESSSDGVALVHARTLYELVRESDSDTMRFNERENYLEIMTDTGDFKINKADPEEFPKLPEFLTESYEIGSDILLKIIEKTAFAASDDETRYQLNGVFMKYTQSEGRNILEAAATDSHRLSRVRYAVDEGLEVLSEGIIVPKRGVNEIKRILREVGERVKIGVEGGILGVMGDGITFTVRLVEGGFPDYESVLPTDFSIEYRTESKKLLKAIRKVMPLAYEKIPSVVLRFREGEIKVASESPEAGAGEEKINAERIKGQDMDVVFNAEYLEDAVKAFDAETVNLKGNDELSAWIMESEEEPNLTEVIMPMRL